MGKLHFEGQEFDETNEAVGPVIAAVGTDGKVYAVRIDPVTKELVVTASGGGGGGLTDAELRAAPVKTDDDETQTLLTTIDAVLDSLNAKDFATETKLEAVRALLSTIDTSTTSLAANQQTDALTDVELRASDVGVQTQREGTDIQVSAATGNRNGAGTSNAITPGAGNFIRLYWVLAGPKPSNTVFPLIKVKGNGATGDFYSGYSFAHWQVKDFAVDEVVQVETDDTGRVDWTLHYIEVTP